MSSDSTAISPRAAVFDAGAASRVRLFAPGHEFFYLAVPMVLAAFFFADWLFFGLLSGLPLERQLIAFITSALFLNNLHVYFTFAFLLKIPEFKAWIAEETAGRPWRFWAEVACVGALVFIVLLISHRHVAIHWRAYLLIGIVLLVLPIHHGVAQMFGLSMLYNRKLANACDYSGEERARADTCARNERWAFRVLLVSYLGTLTAGAISTMLFANNWLPAWFGKVLWLAVLLSVLFILWTSLRYPGALRSNKPLFLSRLLLFPLVPVLPFAYAAISACHGTEYLAVAAKVRERSAISQAGRAQFTYTVLALCILGLGLLICRSDEGIIDLALETGYREAPLWIHLAAYASITLAFVHYYLDRKIFRFRNASCRRHVLPLLS